MSIQNLFVIVLKILGLIVLKQTLDLVPQLIGSTPYIRELLRDNTSGFYLFGFVSSTFLLLVVYGGAAYILIFKPDYLIETLKLTSGFSQEMIRVNTDQKTIIGTAVILLGGYVVVESVPVLMRQLFIHYSTPNYGRNASGDQLNLDYLIQEASKAIIGLILIGEQKHITAFLIKRMDEKADE